VRGAFALMAFGGVAAVWLAVGFVAPATAPNLYGWLAWFALPAAAFAACYTAFLFAQATGRELWATPLAAPHLVVQAAVAGAGVLLMIVAAFNGPAVGVGAPADVAWLRALLGWGLLVHAAFVAAELFTPHRSLHIARAVETILAGKYAREFWVGAVFAGVVLPAAILLASATVLAAALAAGLALLGLYAWEYVWVFAGQSVPLS
jgi:Ni/Fe-hydrogenase subunit HybB-like protein